MIDTAITALQKAVLEELSERETLLLAICLSYAEEEAYEINNRLFHNDEKFVIAGVTVSNKIETEEILQLACKFGLYEDKEEGTTNGIGTAEYGRLRE